MLWNVKIKIVLSGEPYMWITVNENVFYSTGPIQEATVISVDNNVSRALYTVYGLDVYLLCKIVHLDFCFVAPIMTK